MLEQDGDHAALASLWMAAEGLEHYRCRFGAAADAALRAVEHATAAGEEYLASWGRVSAASGIADGPMPVAEALSWLDQQSALLEPRPTWIDFRRSRLLALIGRFEEARAAHESNVEQMTELGDRLGLAVGTAWWIEMEAGQFARAEEAARQSCRLLAEMAERSFWSTKACNLAQALYFLGRYDEAGTWARQGADAGATDDACTQMLSRQVLAKVAARGGQFETARTLAAEALAISERMDAPLFQGVASLDVAEALLLAGDRAGAIREAERAASLFKRKGATVPLGRALRFLETMASGVT